MGPRQLLDRKLERAWGFSPKVPLGKKRSLDEWLSPRLVEKEGVSHLNWATWLARTGVSPAIEQASGLIDLMTADPGFFLLWKHVGRGESVTGARVDGDAESKERWVDALHDLPVPSALRDVQATRNVLQQSRVSKGEIIAFRRFLRSRPVSRGLYRGHGMCVSNHSF